MLTILLIVLILLMVGAFPSAPWATWHNLGPYPSGLALVLVVILCVLLLSGRL